MPNSIGSLFLATTLTLQMVPSRPPVAVEAAQHSMVVKRSGVVVAELWLTRRASSTGKPGSDQDRANFAALGNGTTLGVIRIRRSWRDYRGQNVGPGVYTLQYALQPRLKDHIGTSRFRDFLMLMPSKQKHPMVMAMVPAIDARGRPPRIRVTDGETILEADLAGIRAGLVIEGTGTTEPEL